MSSELRTGNGRLSFRSGPLAKPGVRVEAGVGMIDVSVANTVTYLGVYISTTAARAMAEALNLAADIVDAQTPTGPETRTAIIDEAYARLNGWVGAPVSLELSAAIKDAARAGDPAARSIFALSTDLTVSAVAALLAENRDHPTAAAVDLAASILSSTPREKSI